MNDNDDQSINMIDIATSLLSITLSDNLSLVCRIVYYLLTIRFQIDSIVLIILYKCIEIIVIWQDFNQSSLMIDEGADVN
jgi:hypothetical protein